MALSTSLIPAITEAWTLGSRRLVVYRSEEALRFTLLFGIPSAVGLAVLAEPICAMLFGYVEAAPHLAVLATGAITLGLSNPRQASCRNRIDDHSRAQRLLIGVILKFALTMCW